MAQVASKLSDQAARELSDQVVAKLSDQVVAQRCQILCVLLSIFSVFFWGGGRITFWSFSGPGDAR